MTNQPSGTNQHGERNEEGSTVHVPPEPWQGRDDGPGADTLRWHHVVSADAAGTTAEMTGADETADPADAPGGIAFVGFRSDEGVRRNKGRPGAAHGPAALRRALASMALPGHARDVAARAVDVGDVEVTGGALEAGQQHLGGVVTGLLDGGHTVVVLGGGHEVAFASYQGLVHSARLRAGARLGVLNLDAHFDLRPDSTPSSGTPFRQMAECERERGAELTYAVLGISQPSNTTSLFDMADTLSVDYLMDDDCGPCDTATVDAFVDRFAESCDLIHLSIDLDVLPASTAPGVSAPAAFGVPLATIQRVCDRVAHTGKLVLCDVAELNPALDVDDHTARTAARLIHRILTSSTTP